MKSLWFGSWGWVLCLLLLSCSASKYKGWKEVPAGAERFSTYFGQTHQAAKYKAEVSIFGKHFSGMLFFRFSNDTTCHVAFVTVPGAKLFDMQLTSRTDTVYACLEQLNRPGVIATIQRNIRAFLMLDNFEGAAQPLSAGKFQGIMWRRFTPDYTYHFYQPTGEPITRIELLTRKKGKKKVDLAAGQFKESLPSEVGINSQFGLKIHLMQL